jgi:hypothetical protein
LQVYSRGSGPRACTARARKCSAWRRRSSLRADLREALERVVADGFEHPEALVRVPHEALTDERLQGVEVGVRYLLGCFERTSAAEDRQSREEGSLAVVEQVV